jgi:hypothetical protein
MKWRLRRMMEKCMLFLVSIKPIRWFFDQLFRFGEWASKKPWLQTIWRWYSKLFKPFWYSYLIYSLVIDAWNRNIWNVLMDIACILLVFALDNRHGPDNNEEDEPDEPDPTPNGDAVDLWLKEQQKTLV